MKPNILYLDIETAPELAFIWPSEFKYGRIPADRIVEPGYTMCFSYKCGNEKTVFCRQDIVENAWLLLDWADIVVHYNGAKFDIPMLQTEFIKSGKLPPSPFRQVDLYKWVRANTRFVNNKMETVCQAIGIGKKVKHKGMELWQACMKQDPAAWRIMERYNRRDVTMTHKLYKMALPWIKNHPNVSAFMGRLACPSCGSVSAHKHDKRWFDRREYKRFRCQSCGRVYRDNKPIDKKVPQCGIGV